MTAARVAGIHYQIVSRAEAAEMGASVLAGEQQCHVVTLNPEMVVEVQRNQEFREAVENADLRIADGAGLVWAADYLTTSDQYPWKSLGQFVRRTEDQALPGIDVLELLAEQCQQRQEGMFLLGATKARNERAQNVLQQRFPKLDVQGAGGGAVDSTGPSATLERIRAASPSVLAVAYGAPVQTLWIARHLSVLPSVRVALGVGGALDMLCGATPRAPHWWRAHHLEWVWRWGLQPNRWRRMARATGHFIYLVQREKSKHIPQNQY